MKLDNKAKLVISAVAIVAAAAAAAFIYSAKSTLTIQGQAIGLDSHNIYLESYIGDQRRIVDSVELTKGGEFKFTIKDADSTPRLYELRYGWDRVPFFGQRGENITISSIGRFALNYIIEGSRESELLRDFYQPYVRRGDDLRKVAVKYAEQEQAGEDTSESAKEYISIYNEIKRDQVKFILENKGNMAAIYALSQRLPGDRHLLNESSDLVYMNTVADSAECSYPNSAYVKMLRSQIEDAERRSEIFNNVTYRGYPDITMNDMYGKNIALSSLEGSVVLVDFWSAELSNSNPNNAAMKEMYKELKGRGFEIYQVAIDKSKSRWINAVQQQKLPWISVSDLKGVNSPVMGLYNITKLPANVLIDREGNIIGVNLYGEELRKAVTKAL